MQDVVVHLVAYVRSREENVATPTSISCFFFSSRRRHTRSLCDWSSDVCSSDLSKTEDAQVAGAAARATTAMTFRRRAMSRSEERRVGKECRSRWWPCHEIRKLACYREGEMTQLSEKARAVEDYRMFRVELH